jgi:predicted amidohydrolase
MDNIRVAAIQMRAKVGAVASNLSRAESLAREAFRRGAEWVILPEFFTSALAFAPSMLSSWLPLEGPALELLRTLAREHNGVVGGSFIAKSGQDCFNSFLLVFPNGQYYRHDKDLSPRQGSADLFQMASTIASPDRNPARHWCGKGECSWRREPIIPGRTDPSLRCPFGGSQ